MVGSGGGWRHGALDPPQGVSLVLEVAEQQLQVGDLAELDVGHQ